jgi:hypothetical protein
VVANVVFATMITVARTRDMGGYMRMTENWCVQWRSEKMFVEIFFKVVYIYIC